MAILHKERNGRTLPPTDVGRRTIHGCGRTGGYAGRGPPALVREMRNSGSPDPYLFISRRRFQQRGEFNERCLPTLRIGGRSEKTPAPRPAWRGAGGGLRAAAP